MKPSNNITKESARRANRVDKPESGLNDPGVNDSRPACLPLVRFRMAGTEITRTCSVQNMNYIWDPDPYIPYTNIATLFLSSKINIAISQN